MRPWPSLFSCPTCVEETASCPPVAFPLLSNVDMPCRPWLASPRWTSSTCLIAAIDEGAFRPFWLRYVASEVRQAQAHGVALGGICLYPVVSHLGWDDDRPCANGLFDGHDPEGSRTVFAPLAQEIAEQVQVFARSG